MANANPSRPAKRAEKPEAEGEDEASITVQAAKTVTVTTTEPREGTVRRDFT